MSDINKNILGFTGKSDRVCRVAYTINNYQPVTSTIIDEQPLFYMDYEMAEDELLDAADLNILENEIKELQREIESLDRFAAQGEGDLEKTFDEFLACEKSFCVKGECSETDVVDLVSLKRTLTKSRLAAAYLEFAAEHGVELYTSSQVIDAHYDRKAGKIFLNADLPMDDMVLMAARELRRHYQHRQGALINPLLFHPDNAVLVNRAQVADLSVSMVRVAWELQLTGEKGAWERMEASSMGDLARSFAREAYMDFRTINNGVAAAAVFETWFLSERCRNEDKKLIKQMLADYQGYVFDLEEAVSSVTPTLIAALGEMPFGKNYLAVHADTIMADPIFTDVRDRSNANFLWFIKFERSFRETEQELQTHNPGSADGVRYEAYDNQIDRDLDHATRKAGPQGHEAAEIVSLYEEDGGDTQDANPAKGKKRLAAKKNRKAKGSQPGGAEIVYLRRWSGE